MSDLVWCPVCEEARAVEVDEYDIMVMEQEEPVRTVTAGRCAGCGVVMAE